MRVSLLVPRAVRTVALLLAALAGTACSDGLALVSDIPEYRVGHDRRETVRVAMRDGVELHTDIYFPEGEGPWPAILLRNPYNAFDNFRPIGQMLSRYGYVVVHQDVRGRFDSGGEWLPLLNERFDGIDTVHWLVDQPWQDGNIGLFGASYLSAVQWAIIDQLPPEVKTAVPMIIGTDLRNVVYQNGVFRPEVFAFWAALMPDHELAMFNGVAYQQMLRAWPPIGADERFLGAALPWYRQWLMSPAETDPLWQRWDAKLLATAPERTTIPMLMLSGWYDIFVNEQLDDFRRLGTRDESRLIVGPWTHLMGIIGDGQKDFPGAGSIASELHRIVNWFDHYLKGAPLDDWGPVRTYAIGEGAWHERADWPPAVRRQRYYLRYPERAWSCSGGRITERPADYVGHIDYRYDPRNPVPSRGGAALLSFVMPGWGGTLPSNRNQVGLCERRDVLTFLSAPLGRPMHLSGPITVHLRVKSDAPDTAFTAKLIEVDARGRALNVRDAITTLRFRNGATVPVDYAPGEIVDLDIELWPIEWQFQPGTRLRLDLSSSNFPAYQAHPNRAEPWALVRQPRVATNTIYAGGDAAYVELPLWEPTTVAAGAP